MAPHDVKQWASKHDVKQWASKLALVSDDDLRRELGNMQYRLDDAKFEQAFGCYGTTVVITSIPRDTFRTHFCMPADCPDILVERARWQGSIVLRAYTCFVYMWADNLQKNLDKVSEQSPIRPYKDFFRQGSRKKGEDSIGQHIRNSLAHGSFQWLPQEAALNFEDRGWTTQVDAQVIHCELCPQIKRFYLCAYEAKNGIRGYQADHVD